MNLPVRQSAGFAPLRRQNSVRRTSSIDVSWPGGQESDMRFDARSRDVVTLENSKEMHILAEDSYVACVRQDRTIATIHANPEREKVVQLVGQRGGGHLRKVLAELMPEELAEATPLYLILDDISGASLISGWAWSHWTSDWKERLNKTKNINMEGVCIGFRPGSSALTETVSDNMDKPVPTPELRNPDDPEGWHEFTEQKSTGMRRARRIDIWLEKNLLKVESAFQDSASTPSGERAVLHEYRLQAEADIDNGQLIQIEATPYVLPFAECHGAPGNLQRLVGISMNELRQAVLSELSKVAGCTHLNDALRALADVPKLLKHLP